MSTPETIRSLLADIVRQDFPALNVPPGPHSYRVTAVYSDGRCHLAACKKGPPPELPNVDHWSASGASSKPVVGSLVVVSFLDGDPDAPMIGGYQPLRVAGGSPLLATLDATTIKIGPTDATTIELGGAGAAPLALAGPIPTWATLVNGALSALGVPIAALGTIATTKVKGV